MISHNQHQTVETIYSQIIREFRQMLSEVKINNAYVKRFKNSFENGLNVYINELNLKEIINRLSMSKNSLSKVESLRILDLGCGLGDKAVFIKKYYPKFTVFGLETVSHDDPDHVKNRPQELFEAMYTKVNTNYEVNLKLYDGKNIPFDNSYFDVVLLYAVIEHVSPENRHLFICEVASKLKKGGQIIVTRCPQKYSLIEFVSRIFHLGAHEWPLTKNDLLNFFPPSDFNLLYLKRMNNIPNSSKIPSKYYAPLIGLDKILTLLKWPFFTDFFLVVERIS